MAATTGQLGLVTPTQGTLSGTWGDTVNNGITEYVNIAIAGTLSFAGDGPITLTNTTGSASATNIGSTTAQYMVVQVTGTLTGDKTITAPSYSKLYLVDNTTSTFNVLFKRASQVTPVTIAPSEKAFVYYNGTDYVKTASSIVSATGLSGVVPTANGGTGTASTSTTIAAFNNSAPGYTSVASSGGTTTLTAASTHYQKISGTNVQTFQLPDATTLPNGTAFIFDNDSTGNVTINDNSATLVSTVYPGNFQYIFVESNSTSAGSWGKYASIPAATYVPSGSTGSLATTGKAIAMAIVFG